MDCGITEMGLNLHLDLILRFPKAAEGYYDENGNWNLTDDWKPENGEEINPFPIEKRLDSRGEYRLVSGFVFACGKTFKSGRLNIPVNAFFIPGKKDNHRFGISVGFNTTRY